jgi:two-component system KDP operon response regulator KdpE
MYEQAKVLVIGFDEDERRRVANSIKLSRHEVVTANDWKKGLRELYSQRPNALVVLSDSQTGDSIGWSEVQTVRSLSDIPVIIVADRATQRSLQKAIDLGVAGYLVRPVETRTLTERLNGALERPRRNDTFPQADFRHENLRIDWRRFEVTVDDEVISLSPIEFKLLSLLVERRGEVVTHGEILARVWGPNYDLGDRRNVKLYIWYLRKKLEHDPSRPRWIITRNGLGYIFNAESASAAGLEAPRREGQRSGTSAVVGEATLLGQILNPARLR